MAGAAKRDIGSGWAGRGIALACLALAACADGRPPVTAPPRPPAPMVAPQLPPPSPEFNAQVARPLPLPEPPRLMTLAPPAAPGPVAVMAPLPSPEPLDFTLAPVPQPATPGQIARPMPRPAGSPAPLRDEAGWPPTAAPTPSSPPPANDEIGVAGGFRLLFAPGSAELPAVAAAVLREIAETMAQDLRLRLKVAAYASGEAENPVPARRLSLQRALKVREALAGEGIPSLRIDVLALGITAEAPPRDRVDLLPIH
ncbi:MAG: OmpA family protein [Rhodospirillaceae bacterium]